MLRSILAIWTLALALLAIAATSGCIGGDDCANAAGCSDYYVPPDMAQSRDLADSCPSQCSGCLGSELCFEPSGAAELPAFCATPCKDDRDCAAGSKCATLFAALQPSICISAGKPHGCGGTSPNWHCDLAPAACKDSVTAQVAFSDAANQVCGWEQVHCPGGCANGACL